MLFAMHIPDGFLHSDVAAAAWCVAAAMLVCCARQLRAHAGHRAVPLVGVTAAGIFAAQMVNFPLPGVAASGHLIGGVLAGVLLGPWAGALAITAVLIVQCLVFGDGGLLALGANMVNMAGIGAIGGYGVYRVLSRALPGPRGTVAAAAIAAWLAPPAAALAFSVEMTVGRLIAFPEIAPLMLMYHALIGVGEALITAGVVAWITRAAPELLYRGNERELPFRCGRGIVATGLSFGLAMAIFAAPWASDLDDGLEAVARRLGFAEQAQESSFAPFPDYTLRDSAAEVLAPQWPKAAAWTTAILGALGTLGTCVFAVVVMRAMAAGSRDNLSQFPPAV